MTVSYPTNSRFFTYREGALYAESVPVKEIAETYGTPTYVYSSAAVLEAFDGYKRGLEGIPSLIAYAVKANGNLSILNLLAKAGAGADLTSGGELYVALRGGIPAERMVFSGVGKTDEEIEQGLQAGILMFNVESEPELENIARIAQSMGKKAPIAVRVNPNIDAKTHPKISTGLKEHKFGIPWEQAEAVYQKAAQMEWIEVRGIAAHIGSSLMDVSPLLQALDKLLSLRKSLIEKGIEIPYLDIGGGLGIQYQDTVPAMPEEYTRQVRERIKESGVTLILEPGRSIVGNAGILITKVQYVKKTDDRTFVVVDAGMNDLARPAIYGAYHQIVPVEPQGLATELVDVVGPICESSDVFGKERNLPSCKAGDYLALCSAGAYGFAMSSHYNGRVKPAEVMVEGDVHRLVRKRETYEELCRHQLMEALV